MFRWIGWPKTEREMSSCTENTLSDTSGSLHNPVNGSAGPSHLWEVHNVYEQFDPKIDETEGMGTQTCPTCGGTGKLTKEQEHDLVALIPVRDRRLKPRRTILYLIIAIFLCLALCTVIGVVFFPRSISLKLGVSKLVNITVPKDNKTDPFIIVNNTVSLKNENFFEAQLDNFTIEVNWDNFVVANPEITHVVKVPAHSSLNYTFNVKTKYKGNEANKIRRICCGWSYNLAFVITISAKTHSLTVSSETSDVGVRYINCEIKGKKWWHSCFSHSTTGLF